MSELLKEFRIFSKFNQEIKKKIKIFHVFHHNYKTQNVFFITSDDECDDKVFSFGYNNSGFCGLGGNQDNWRDINEPQVIPELCGKYVQHFFAGQNFVLGLTKDKQVYGWGDNHCGQLGREIDKSSPRKYLKPGIIDLPSVIQLSCELHHTIALTCDGRVFGWGQNSDGQIMCGKEENIISPIHLKTFEPFTVKLLKTSVFSSYALTVEGLVYKWGDGYCSMGHAVDRNEHVCEPLLITNIPKMLMICPLNNFHLNHLYLLSNERDIYLCEFYQPYDKEYEEYELRDFRNPHESSVHPFKKTPKLINNGIKFSSLHSSGDHDHITAISDKTVCVFRYGDEMEKSDHKNYFEYYSIEYESSFKTIHLDVSNISDGYELKDIQNYKVFEYVFEKMEPLGRGGYGKVYRTKYNYNKKDFAIKIISFKGKNDILISLLELNVSF